MKSKSIILIAIALGCGLVASIGISQVMGRSQKTTAAKPAEIQTVTIAVAMRDLDIGATLTSDKIKLEEWPSDHVPEGTVTDMETLKGKFPRVRVTKGQPIMHSMLMDSLDKKIIPEGYRVIPIRVSAETISGLVLPGDRVDVLVLLMRGRASEITKTMVRTVIKDVRIFDVNSQTERIIEEGGKTQSVKTVSLLLTPSQVELMTLALEMGKLRFALRRHNDTKGGIYDGAEIPELLGTQPKEGSKDLEKDNSFADFLRNRPTAPVPMEPVHTMEILTPNGTTAYTWTDVNKRPQVTEIGNGSLTAAASALDIPALGVEAKVDGKDDSADSNSEEDEKANEDDPKSIEGAKLKRDQS